MKTEICTLDSEELRTLGSCGFFKVKPDLELWVTTMDKLVTDISQKKVTRYIRLTDR